RAAPPPKTPPAAPPRSGGRGGFFLRPERVGGEAAQTPPRAVGKHHPARHPVLSENLTGLARMVRAYVTPAMENVALWHERDISHSSVERMIGPDATVTLDFALNRLAGLVEKLLIYPANMQKNLDRLGGLAALP